MTLLTVTAYFEDKAEAARAVEAIVTSGVSRPRVSTMAGDTASTPEQDKGFWTSLGEMFGMDDERHTYHEGLRRGGTIVAVRAEETEVDSVVAILQQHCSVNLGEREQAWRGEGWTGRATGYDARNDFEVVAATTGRAADLTMTDTDTVQVAAAPVAAVAAPLRPAPASSASDDKLQVVEERLDIGKKAVERGKVRIHTSVIETPVSEEVRLLDEKVRIERRPANGVVGAVGADPFRERTIEMTETGEEAVIAKSVRVIEEIGITKEVGQRTETVSDTVRSTKVEVDDTRANVAGVRAGGFSTQVEADMQVVGADGGHVGTVDHLDGTSIKLKRMDLAAGGQHHLIPLTWVASIADRNIILSKTTTEAEAAWTAT